jgi:hypothetical protein
LERQRDRQIARNLDLSKQQCAGIANAEAEHATGDSHEQALGNQLANEPTAAGADRQPERHLTRTHRRPACQQSGDIAARDEQHAERERRQHRDQRRVRWIFRDACLELSLHEILLVLVCVRIRTVEIRADRRQLALRLRLRDAGLEPAFHAKVSHVARLERASPLVGAQAWRHHQRHEEIRSHDRVHAGERLGRHADHRERHAVDPHGAPQHTYIRREFLFPHRPAEHDDGVAAGYLIFVGSEGATERWLDAHQREQIAARHHSQFELGGRRGIGREPDGHIRERGQAIKALSAIADVDVIVVRRDE